MDRHSQPSKIRVGGRNLVNVNQSRLSPQTPQTQQTSQTSQLPKDFTPSSPGQIKVGTKVEHPRFGIGEVKLLEGAGSNVKATVLFPIGKKQLLLKFAKLRVVE